ncbi:hypothetical protein F4780DRAFT_739379 [Xylariomycetidae sp. FL0641]|nr:hypothetical protein F4780DRAFT_739379 [Xylariomycetidae sp. FL0641]
MPLWLGTLDFWDWQSWTLGLLGGAFRIAEAEDARGVGTTMPSASKIISTRKVLEELQTRASGFSGLQALVLCGRVSLDSRPASTIILRRCRPNGPYTSDRAGPTERTVDGG